MNALVHVAGHKMRRLWRALVGRACRYRFGRAALGGRGQEPVVVRMLGPALLELWEGYLRVPRGSLKPPGEGTYCAVATVSTRVIGHVTVFRQWERADVNISGWWLTGLEVVPRWRGRAIGRALVARVIDEWRIKETGSDLHLVVHRRNAPAISLFERFGFRPIRHEEWESKLSRVYGGRRGDWPYLIMTLKGGNP